MLSCDAAAFGGDPTDGASKQCFCEPNPDLQPYVCAAHGEDCSCPRDSIVLFGRQTNKKNPGAIANYKQAVRSKWTAAFMENRESIKCDSSSFDGVDPLPASAK